jgi:hypothetical protein
MTSGAVDLTGLDVCTLLTEQTVQDLTGSSEDFASQGGRGACFWAVTRPGVPAYVEVMVRSSQRGLDSHSFSAGCTPVPVTAVGTEAKGATCAGTQTKVYLVAFDRGVILEVLVNEPERPLQPADIGAVANQLLQQITAG